MKILLFDWTDGGHHARYVQRFASVLREHATVCVAVPESVAPVVANLGVEVVSLGAARPQLTRDAPAGVQHRALAEAELAHVDRVVLEWRPDHLVHLYADPVLRWWVGRPLLPAAITLCLFFVRAHYPSAFGSRLSWKERLRAEFQALLVARWRRRRDAHAVFMLDEVAAKQWGSKYGAAVSWLPEPPVKVGSHFSDVRNGCVLYGALAPRKGIELLARAVATSSTKMPITLAGAVEPGFERELDRHVATMRNAGADVRLEPHHHTEADGLTTLARARVAVLPYPMHYGMSRVLVESCSVGTPVVVHDWGLVAHLVREYGLGAVVDCRNPRALAAAIDGVASTDATVFAPRLARFAGRFDDAAFAHAVTRPFLRRSDHSRTRLASATADWSPGVRRATGVPR